MASSTPFDTLKSQILASQRVYGVCPGYYEAMRTKDYQELIDAGIPNLVNIYLSGVLNDDILASIDETLLNDNGIYTTNATIENPLYEIFVLGNAVVNITVDNGEKHNVNVMGTGTANITVSNNTFCVVNTFQNAEASVIVNDTSAICMETAQQSMAQVTGNDSSTFDIAATGNSIFEGTFNNTSFALVQGFEESTVNVTGTGQTVVKYFDLSKEVLLP